MRTRWLVTGLVCWTVVAPARSAAQESVTKEAKEEVHEAMRTIFGPHWKLYVHGGLQSQGRLLLQRMTPLPSVNEQIALRGDRGFNIGGGAAVDFLATNGLRASYTYGSTDLAFRQDDGNGSTVLDMEKVGRLRSHIAALELVHYLFPYVVKVTPYGTVGLVGAWWVLHQQTPLVQPTGGSTQFRLGVTGSIGLRAKLNKRVAVRLEAASATVSSPFAGRSSFRAFGGTTIDEPTRVPRTDFRLAIVYGFGEGSRRGKGVSARRKR